MANDKVTTTVDPNTEPSKSGDGKEQADFGAKTPMDHPLTHSTVDANYSDDSSGAPADGARRPRKSETEDDESAGVEGSGGSFTDMKGE